MHRGRHTPDAAGDRFIVALDVSRGRCGQHQCAEVVEGVGGGDGGGAQGTPGSGQKLGSGQLLLALPRNLGRWFQNQQTPRVG